MYRTPYTDAQGYDQRPAHLVSLDRGNGSLVGVTRQRLHTPLVGVALPAAVALPARRAFDASGEQSQEIAITLDTLRGEGQIVTESYVLNPERLADSIVGVGDVELGSPIYVAQHLALVGLLTPPTVNHVEAVIGVPFNVWDDKPFLEQLRQALRGLHHFTLRGVERFIYLSPILLPQPVMAVGCLTVPEGIPDTSLLGALVGILDPGTGTDDTVLVRGFKAEAGRSGVDFGTRALAEACEVLWARLREDARFPLLRRVPSPGTHALLALLDAKVYEYEGVPCDIGDHVAAVLHGLAERIAKNTFSTAVWGNRIAEIAAIGVASGGGEKIWPYLAEFVEPAWRRKLQLLQPVVVPLTPDPFGRSTAVYAVAAGGYYTRVAQLTLQQQLRQAQTVTAS